MRLHNRINAVNAVPMDQQSTVRDIEEKARQRRISIPDLCARAEIAASTFYRWKKSPTNPRPKGANFHLVERLYGALAAIDAEDTERLSRDGKAVAA